MTKGALVLLVLLLFSWAGGYFFWELSYKPTLNQIEDQKSQIEKLQVGLKQSKVPEEIVKEVEIPPRPEIEKKNAWAKELSLNLPYQVKEISDQNLTLVEGLKIKKEDITSLIIGEAKREIEKKTETFILPTERIVTILYPYSIDFQKDDWVKLELSWKDTEPILYLKKIPPKY